MPSFVPCGPLSVWRQSEPLATIMAHMTFLQQGAAMDVFGMFGFVFALLALTEIQRLKKEVERLHKRLSELPSESESK